MTEQTIPTRETEYIEYLQESPATTTDLMEHFSSKKRAVYQNLYTLQLTRSVQAVKENGIVYWQAVDDPMSVLPSRLTEHRRRHLEFMLEPRTTRDVMDEFGCKYSSAIWNIRTLRLMGYVERCERTWQITDAGLAALEDSNE